MSECYACGNEISVDCQRCSELERKLAEAKDAHAKTTAHVDGWIAACRHAEHVLIPELERKLAESEEALKAASHEVVIGHGLLRAIVGDRYYDHHGPSVATWELAHQQLAESEEARRVGSARPDSEGGARYENIVYHPDPEINAGVAADAAAAERADLKAGYEPRRWKCPQCGASHARGFFPSGSDGHRCLGCGYSGIGGVMWNPKTEPEPSKEPTGEVCDECGLAGGHKLQCSQRLEGGAR